MATQYLFRASSLLALRSHHECEQGRNFSSSSTRSVPSQFRKCTTICAKPNDHHRSGKILSSGRRARAAAADDDDAAAESAATKGRKMWRSELESVSDVANDRELLDGATLERDIERFVKKEEMEKLWSQADRSRKDGASDQGGGGSGVIRDAVDKILVADFFFILVILAWLLAGLAERAAFESTSLIDSWLPLWPSVFQPALGVFMAGAIVSAITKKK